MVCTVCAAVVGWKWGRIDGVYAWSPWERQKRWSKNINVKLWFIVASAKNKFNQLKSMFLYTHKVSVHGLQKIVLQHLDLFQHYTFWKMVKNYLLFLYFFVPDPHRLSSSRRLSMLCSPALWWTSSHSSTRASRSSGNWIVLTLMSWLSTAAASPRWACFIG